MSNDELYSRSDRNIINALAGRKNGCPCACHGTREVHHMVPCHNPMLRPGDPSLPRVFVPEEVNPDGR